MRALYESRAYREALCLVAINETWHPDTVLHLTRFDSIHGRFPKDVRKTARGMAIENDEICLLQEKNIENLPWKDLEVDAVLDCTGIFNDRQAAKLHILSGAAKVIYSHPGKDEMDATIIYGVNHSYNFV